MECPVLLGRSSEPMDFRQFRASINRLQYYDSFPGDGDSENQLHKIVKKQMAVSDYKDPRKNKRSISDFPESFGDDDGDQCESESHAKKRAAINPVSQIGQPSKAQPRKMRSFWRKSSSGSADARAKADASQTQPKNKNNRWLGRELRHRRWPGEVSSSKKASRSMERERGGKRGISKSPPFDNTDDPDPANEWLDASKGGVVQKIPAEFRPKKKPRLKIYHLRVKRKLEQLLQSNIVAGHRGLTPAHVENHRKAGGTVRGIRMHSSRHHHPRSFVIRINKKYGRDNQDEKITDGEENDEEDEETEEEEEDEEDAEEDDDAEEEEDSESKQTEAGVNNHKDSFKDLLRSAKAAVTNRVRFAEASGLTEVSQKPMTRVKGKKSESGYSPKGKKVLIDANIKVDSAVSDVLRNILKTTGMVNGVGSGSGSGMASDSDLLGGKKDSELLRAYEHLSRSNPRFRRCRKKGH